MNLSSKVISRGAIIAALYVVLTMIASVLGLSSGPVQVRLSEALCILPCFTAAAIPGLFVGCIIANVLSGAVFLDVIFGSLTTLLAAVCTWFLRKHRFLASLPPILLNALVIPWILHYAYGIDTAIWLIMLSVAAGEALSAGVLGQLFYNLIQNRIRPE